ncbi:MAG: oligosaccharide flippase family protein [bacterium]|nr:oligosaccharide flippase family protein [bacterium]
MPQGVKKGALFSFIGLGGSGSVLFIFNVIAARTLGPANFGVFNILYSLIGPIATLLASGAADGIIRFSAAAEAMGEKAKISNAIRNGSLLTMALFIVFLVFALSTRNFIQTKYLDNKPAFFSIFILSVLFCSIIFLLRGIFQGLREFKYYSLSTLSEPLTRLIFLLLLVNILHFGITGACGSLLIGYFISLIPTACLCLTLRDRFTGDNKEAKNESQKEFFSFAALATFIHFFRIFILRSGPIFLKMLGGTDANLLTGLYSSALVLLNSLHILFTALSTAIFPNLTRVEVLKEEGIKKRYIKKAILLATGLASLMIILFSFLGAWILKVIYGKEFILSRLDLFLISSMMGFYFIAELLNYIFLAKLLTKEAFIIWSVSFLFLILFIYLSNLPPLLRVELGLCIASFLNFIFMFTKLIIIKK